MVAMIGYGTMAIKYHITYPRTGFVAYRTQNRIWTVILGSVVSVVVSAGLVLAARPPQDSVMPVFFLGLFLAACYALGFARAVPWKWAVVSALVLGSLAIAVLPGDLTSALAYNPSVPAWFSARGAGAFLLCITLFGTLLLISGAISFWLYLRHTQAPAKEANEPANSDVH
jgi:hypothetical protein